MEIRKCYQSMIRAYPGGWDAMSAALGYSRCKLENLVYERGGAGSQYMSVNDALQMQAFSQTADFAAAVARCSGGVFVPLVDLDSIDNADINQRLLESIEWIGRHSERARKAIEDGVIDSSERRELDDTSYQVMVKWQEHVTLLYRVYCLPEKVDAPSVQLGASGAKNNLCGESIA